MDEKLCGSCWISRPTTDFYSGWVKKRQKNVVHTECKLCTNKRSSTYYRLVLKGTNKVKRRNRIGNLKGRYGLTEAQYFDMVSNQSSKCAICNIIPTKKLHIDHDHSTGKIRGLLCRKCNYGLGNFRDSLLFLSEAIKYLNRQETQ